MLIDAVKRCQASLFTDRALGYRTDQGFDRFKVSVSVAVIRMVRRDLASGGVMISSDTESGHPDEFYVHRPTLRQGFRSVLRRTLGDKQIRMVYAPDRTREPVVKRPTPKADRALFCLNDADVLELAGAAITVADHCSRRAGEMRPMDIGWTKGGPDGAV